MSIKVGNAPVSWGVMEVAGWGEQVPYGKVLDEITEAGYVGTELGPYGYFPTDPNELRSELSARGLQLVASFLPIPLAHPHRHEAGYHHHAGTFVETPEEIARLCESTDPNVLGLCLDTGHYFFGGGDPVDAVRLYGERIRHLHLKDVQLPVLEAARRDGFGFLAAVRRGVFCELGDGAVDLKKVIEKMRDVGYSDWAIVEQDVDTRIADVNPLESAIRSRQYLRNIIGI